MSLRKTAVVFGATGRVGKAVCVELARAGMNVIVHYHNNRKKALLVSEMLFKYGISSVPLQADVTDIQQVEKLFSDTYQQFGNIDTIVNLIHKDNGSNGVQEILIADMEWSDFERHLMSIKAHFNICKSVIPYLRRQGHGHIIYISGGLAYRFFKGNSAFSTVKAGLNAFSKTLALEEGSNHITVNIIAPGKIVSGSDDDEDFESDDLSKCPLGRYATAEDIGKAVVFFASSSAENITGQTIYICGGEIMPMP